MHRLGSRRPAYSAGAIGEGIATPKESVMSGDFAAHQEFTYEVSPTRLGPLGQCGVKIIACPPLPHGVSVMSRAERAKTVLLDGTCKVAISCV